MDQGTGCGDLYDCYVAVSQDDLAAARERWARTRDVAADRDEAAAAAVDDALDAGETATARERLAELVFVEDDEPALDGALATIWGTLLYGFGYAAAHVLFVGVDSREDVKERLRWAYRTVGVDVRARESVEGVERTVFRCPYRNLGADTFGQRRVCHDVLDRVDDGYVTYLARHRDLEYDRPRPCAGGECCYSEVRER
ncbi:MAG: hypothetical protein ABEJ74_05130 [Haloferacaceae archaeon]